MRSITTFKAQNNFKIVFLQLLQKKKIVEKHDSFKKINQKNIHSCKQQVIRLIEVISFSERGRIPVVTFCKTYSV